MKLTKQYDNETASLMAELSQLAYVKGTYYLKDLLKRISGKLVWEGDEAGTQCMLVEFKEFWVLAFRGTEINSFADIKTDFKARQERNMQGGKVHSGFNQAYQCIKAPLRKILPKMTPLYITGHSLGGALAVIAAADLSRGYPIWGCYTFGAPKVGDAEFGQRINVPMYRVVNAIDAVPMLPPYFSFGGYRHVGSVRYLTNCPAGNYDSVRLLKRAGSWWRFKQFLRSQRSFDYVLKDHQIHIYKKKLLVLAPYKTS